MIAHKPVPPKQGAAEILKSEVDKDLRAIQRRLQGALEKQADKVEKKKHEAPAGRAQHDNATIA